MAVVKTAKVWLGGRRGITAPIRVSQYDTGWQFQLTVYDGDNIYVGSGGEIAVLNGKKANGSAFSVAGTFSSGVATFDCPVTITEAVGTTECELRLTAGGATIGTANFDMIVEEAPLSGYYASGEDFSAVAQLIDNMVGRVPDAAADWLEDHITNPSNPPIDTSLSVSGAAADAAVAGNKIGELKSTIGSIELSVFDYGQNLFDSSTATDNKRVGSNGSLVDETGSYASDYIEVTPNTVYIKNSPTQDLYHRIAYYTAERYYIENSVSNDNITIAPNAAKYARFCGYSAEKNTAVFAKATVNDANARRNIELIKHTDALSYAAGVAFFENDFYSGSRNGNSIGSIDANEKVKNVIVESDKIANYLTCYYRSEYYLKCIRAFYNSAGARISAEDSWSTVKPGKAIADPTSIPSGAKYVVFNFAFHDGTSFVNWDSSTYIYGAFANQEKKQFVVAKEGISDFASIQSAVNFTDDGDTIFVMPGVYAETVRMWGKNRQLIGTNPEACVIYSGSGLYAYPAIEANIGLLKNLSLISGNDNSLSEDSTVAKAYALHSEFAMAAEHTLVLDNCILRSALNAAFGAGVRYNQHIIVKNCIIEALASKVYSTSTSSFIDIGGLLFHNDAEAPSGSGGNGSIEVYDSQIVGKTKAIMCRSMDNNNNLTARFKGCIAHTSNNNTVNIVGYWGGSSKGVEPYFCGTDIVLDKFSFGNLSDELNHAEYWS